MKKLILFTIIATIFFSPTIALAKGGHGGHGGHHGGSHSSHLSKAGGSKSSSKSTSHTSKYSVLHDGGKSTFARNAFRASSNATPVSSWKSLHTETKAFTDTTNDIPPLYRSNSATNYLLYQSLFHPRHHYVPVEQKPEDLQKEEDRKNIHNILLMIGGTILVAVILVGILMLFF